MQNPTCVFDFMNDSSCELKLNLEPEGAQFVLPPGEAVQIQLFGSESPILVKQTKDKNGQIHVSFWPESGTYELFFKGKRIWDLM